MTAQVRQNIYGAWLDGEATDMEALRSLCSDYEELDQAYRDYEKMRDQTRAQISEVVDHLGGRAEIKGFGTLVITPASVTEGYDKAAIRVLIAELQDDYPMIADRLAACSTKSMRAGGLRIEREKK